MRTALFALFHAAFFGVTVLVAQAPTVSGTMSEVPLPGGLTGALAAVGDRATPDRAQFLAEFIRRMYDTPLGPRADAREPILQSILSQLKSASPATDTIPLPLTSKFWIDVVFRKQATPETLVASIVQSRGAALLYNALLTLDDETRAWIANEPGLISEIVARRAAPFLTVSPGLRVTKAGVHVPGGAAADPVWQALVGRRPTEAVDFVRSLLSADDGRLAFFFGGLSHLSAAQIQSALSLDASDAARRVDAGRRLYSVFERLWMGRALEQRVFVRPSFDPALLISELQPDADQPLVLPGTRALWSAVFADDHQSSTKNPRQETTAIQWDQTPDFAWLCDQAFKGEVSQHRRHYMMILFASRHAAGISKETAHDAIEAIRAVADYPALSATLERAGVSDLAVFAAAARRASSIRAVGDESRTYRALAQYQGGLAMVTRAATRGTITAADASRLIAALAAIPIGERGDYEGRIGVWLAGWLNPDRRSARKTAASGPAADGSVEEVYESAGGPIEEDALRVLSGPEAPTPRLLDWEGTRYRVDLPRAEAIKLTRSQGQSSRPYLSSAQTVLSIADALATGSITRDILQQQVQLLERLSQTDPPEPGEEPVGDALNGRHDTLAALQRAARSGDVNAGSRLAPALRLLADELLARGLMEWAYAVALGPRDGISISAADAAARHDFGLRPAAANRAAPWQLPSAGTDATQRWRVFGSLLGLDVSLADFSLVRLSTKPPPRPTLAEIDRRVFIDTLALVEPKSLSDADRDAIAAAIRRGRARIDALQSPAEVPAIAGAVHMSPQRRTLLAWTVVHDHARVAAFLSPTELFWLGRGEAAIANLDAWGVPAGPRRGCLCVRVVKGQSTDVYAGRWNTGMTASAFPDLNLRLAELLSDLHMPASLLAPVLTSATLDFINSATSRDQDDRRGLSEFVQSLKPDRVEQYLALLTTDGPLVPVGDTPGKDSNVVGTGSHVVKDKR